MKKSKPLLLSLLITAVIGFVVFYFELPAINLQNSEFYGFAFMLAAIFCVAYWAYFRGCFNKRSF